MPQPIEQLVAAARRGDRDAADSLWRANRRFVAAVLLAHTDARELEDLLQEVALRVTRSLADLADAGSLRAWLRTIARRIAIDHGRRRALEPPRPQLLVGDDRDADAAPDVVFDAPERQRWRDELDHAMRHIADLAPDYREPLLLRTIEGLSQREVADVLGVPETTVETRLARARRCLRERFERDERQHNQTRSRDDCLRRTVD